MNLIKPLAIRRLSSTMLPPTVGFTIHQAVESELKCQTPALTPALGI